MFEIDPFPRWPDGGEVAEASGRGLSVVIPTRDRPERLARCIAALEAARGSVEFEVYVCDSSSAEIRRQVAEICAEHRFVRLVLHDRVGAAAARNVGVRAAPGELIVVLDDDVYVDDGAIDALVAEYERQGGGSTVVAGAVTWSHWTSKPLVMRRIGFGRDARPGEEPEFLVSALMLFPKWLALELPWNERLWPYDDRYATLVWRAAGARLRYAPDATAVHDSQESDYPVSHHADRVYVNLIDAALLEKRPGRLAGFEVLSFAACAKTQRTSWAGIRTLCRAWARGHSRFFTDLDSLRLQVRRAKELARADVSGP